MLCPSCQHENPPGAKFCLECGSPFSVACPGCDTPLPAAAKFCIECGTRIAPPAVPVATPVREPGSQPVTGEGERRQLTVMFCDLAASTELSQRLDPEELREVIRAYQAVAAEAVRTYDGTIAQYLGDGVLVYFGYPRAHEDDAERAVRAGLAILAGMEESNLRLERDLEVRLALRIGIHTGPVVVAEIGGEEKRERAAIGETPNVASHLSDAAPPDSVLLSHTTHHLVKGLFACESLGELSLKGLSQPLGGHRVLRESGVGDRFGVAALSGLSPFVGRERELALLVDRWERAKEGTGQVAGVSGEAGIGKSRLIAMFRQGLAGEPHLWLECRCSPYHQSSALYPVIDLVGQVIGLGPDDTLDEKLAKLESAFERHAPEVVDAAPLLASLLSIPFAESYTLPVMTPQRQKHVTLEALLSLLLALTEERPVVFLFEDLHWVDPSTLELLSLLVEQHATSPALILLVYRPEFLPPWPERTYMTHLTLSRLKRAEVETLVAAIAPGHESAPDLLRKVAAKSDGIPLFAEELTRMVLEVNPLPSDVKLAAAGAAAEIAIPPTLRDSLMARLDRLGAEKQVAQLAACIGRSFSYQLLREVSPFSEQTLEAALERLMNADLIYARGLPPRATYLFKHALIQETAYQSLLKRKRRQYHRQIAEAIEKQLPEIAEAQPELLAQHYSEAGCTREAIDYWLQAGQRAIARSANQEAIDHLSLGIALVPQLEEPEDQVRLELVLQTLLGIPLTLSRGYAAPAMERAFARAYELADRLGEAPELFETLNGLRAFYHVSGKLETAREIGDRLARLSEQTRDPVMALKVEYVQGAEALFSGRLLESRAHLDRAMELYDPKQHRADLFTFTEEPGSGSLLYAGCAYWLLGQPDRALRAHREALAIAEQAHHPHTLAFGYAFAAALHMLCGNPESADGCGETAVRIGNEQGFPLWAAMGTMFRGWALTERVEGDRGIAEIRRGFDDWRATGAGLGGSLIHAMLAEACYRRGDLAEAGSLIEEAMASLEKTGEHFFEPELHRLRGVLRRAEDPEDSRAERCLLQDMALARDSHSRSLELRAVASWSRLLRDQGRRREARSALAQVIAGFSEGLDTRDLRDGQALLDELS
jgi:class 3 adenylate cyclase/tetratricopeptide (TPR) repeat protein